MTTIAAPSPAVVPDWVEAAFALPDGARQAFAVDGVLFDISVAALRLESELRPIQIVHIIPGEEPGSDRASLALFRDLKAGALRHRRPIEGRIAPAGMIRQENPYGYGRALWRLIKGFDHLGFYVTEGVHYETLERVSIAHLPQGLVLPFTDAHRDLARQAIGLHAGWRADRNAFCADIGTTTYARFMEMRAAGYALRSDCVAGRTYFGLTPRGFAEAMRPGERTIWGKIPDRIVLRGDAIDVG